MTESRALSGGTRGFLYGPLPILAAVSSRVVSEAEVSPERGALVLRAEPAAGLQLGNEPVHKVVKPVGVPVDVEVEAIACVGVNPVGQVAGNLLRGPDDDPVTAGDVVQQHLPVVTPRARASSTSFSRRTSPVSWPGFASGILS